MLSAAIPHAPADRPTAGLVFSLLLHGLAFLLLLFALPQITKAPPRMVRVAPLNLVQLGAETVSPPAADIAPIPQQQAKETAPQEPPVAVPVEQTPPPPVVAKPTADEAAPHPLPPARPDRRVTNPPVRAARPAPSPAARQPPQAAPSDALSEQLAQLSQLKQLPAPLPANPRQQDGTGQSNVTARSSDTSQGLDAAYAVRDFIRAQVERRWNPDAIKPGWTVAIHMILRPDGSVTRAEIVDERRYLSDRAYHAFALSARNAVLLSSPLNIPAGQYDLAKDIVVEFDPKRVKQ